MKYETKDSGKRQEFTSGMQRDTTEGKLRYGLILPDMIETIVTWTRDNTATQNLWTNVISLDPENFNVLVDDVVYESIGIIIEELYRHNPYTVALDELAVVMTNGAKKYNDHNWKKASGIEEYARFYDSCCRHLMQHLKGENDECHRGAVLFNLQGMLYVYEKVKQNGKKKEK